MKRLMYVFNISVLLFHFREKIKNGAIQQILSFCRMCEFIIPWINSNTFDRMPESIPFAIFSSGAMGEKKNILNTYHLIKNSFIEF